MAASQLPRHDFAPAWLKLPSNENSAWKQTTGDRFFYQPPGSERSVSHHIRSNANSRGAVAYDDIAAQQQSFHHHQQFVRPRFYSNDDYEITLNGVGPRSGSRHGHNSRSHTQVNGVYSEPQHLSYTTRQSIAAVNGTHAVQKKPQRPKDGRSGSVSGIGNGQSRKVESAKPASSVPMLDDEFRRDSSARKRHISNNPDGHLDKSPSLNGDASSENSKLASSKVMSVWDSPSRQSKNIGRSSNSSSEAGHKALILKTGSAKRWAGQSAAGSSKATSGVKDGGKEPNAYVEGLNSFLVTHPKNIGDKKSNFLRSLRRESHESDTELNGFDASCSGPTSPAQDSEKAVFDDVIGSNMCKTVSDSGGREDLSGNNLVTTPIEIILSSSHEAEQRLLREMGWKETDEEESYEITEADVLEFENLRRRFQISCSASTKRNGFAHELPAKTIGNRPLSFPIFNSDVLLPDLDPDSESLSDSSDDVDNFVQRSS